MTEFSRELIFGKRPIRRTDRKPGESEWYYLDPRGASTFSDMKKIDVPTENTPNPYANEIQNYLYKNDEYNYRELYGDTPPPVPQPATQPTAQPATQPTTQENKDTLNQIGKNLNNILKSKKKNAYICFTYMLLFFIFSDVSLFQDGIWIFILHTIQIVLSKIIKMCRKEKKDV